MTGRSLSFDDTTTDDRFVVKEISRTELESFLIFAPSYFTYLENQEEGQSAFAKLFALFRIERKDANGKVTKTNLVVMDNVLYGSFCTHVFDLKGSMRNRHINAANTDIGQTLLDENFLEYLHQHSIFLSDSCNNRLQQAIVRDTDFLARVNVMDYSLMLGIDSKTNQITVGIIGNFFSARRFVLNVAEM